MNILNSVFVLLELRVSPTELFNILYTGKNKNKKAQAGIPPPCLGFHLSVPFLTHLFQALELESSFLLALQDILILLLSLHTFRSPSPRSEGTC